MSNYPKPIFLSLPISHFQISTSSPAPRPCYSEGMNLIYGMAPTEPAPALGSFFQITSPAHHPATRCVNAPAARSCRRLPVPWLRFP